MSDQIDHPEAIPAARPRRLPKVLGTVALVVGVGIVSSLTTVWATHDFPDVPTGSPHHADISWLAETGITTGYNDGTFRPTQAVSRQAMASFLRRYNAEITIVTDAGNTSGASDSWQDGASCPTGYRAIAGGGQMSGVNIFMRQSYPVADTWYVQWETDDSAAIGSRSFTVYALCAPPL